MLHLALVFSCVLVTYTRAISDSDSATDVTASLTSHSTNLLSSLPINTKTAILSPKSNDLTKGHLDSIPTASTWLVSLRHPF